MHPLPSRCRTSHAVAAAQPQAVQDCLQQARVCCDQARTAATAGRLDAAQGLIATAEVLYRRAITLGGSADGDIQVELDGLQAENNSYADLAKSRRRPLRLPLLRTR